MEAMNEAKKKVLKELISQMRQKMLAMGEEPEAAPESKGEPEAPASEESLEEEVASEAKPKDDAKPGVTITLAAIKKGMAAKRAAKPAPAPASETKAAPKKKG